MTNGESLESILFSNTFCIKCSFLHIFNQAYEYKFYQATPPEDIPLVLSRPSNNTTSIFGRIVIKQVGVGVNTNTTTPTQNSPEVTNYFWLHQNSPHLYTMEFVSIQHNWLVVNPISFTISKDITQPQKTIWKLHEPKAKIIPAFTINVPGLGLGPLVAFAEKIEILFFQQPNIYYSLQLQNTNNNHNNQQQQQQLYLMNITCTWLQFRFAQSSPLIASPFGVSSFVGI